MADYADPQLVHNLDNALEQLESSLAEAGRSLGALRHNVTQLASLVEVVREMEDMMNKARANLGMESIATSTQPALRPMPQQEPFLPPLPEPIAALPEIEELPAPEPQPDPIEVQIEPESQQAIPASVAESAAGEMTSHCLRLGVASKAGSLDLKAVDGSVNENPAVVDVALLDYDGRKATLKLWINGAADPVGVRDALLGSLRRRLGDESDAEVQIEFEGAA
ncbi:MAG: hypothetical protein WEB04_02165 [Dehalococcoidia bacterium]